MAKLLQLSVVISRISKLRKFCGCARKRPRSAFLPIVSLCFSRVGGLNYRNFTNFGSAAEKNRHWPFTARVLLCFLSIAYETYAPVGASPAAVSTKAIDGRYRCLIGVYLGEASHAY